MLYRSLLVAAVFGVALLAFSAWSPAEQPEAMKIKAPGFTGIQEWINSKPLEWKDLRGQVVVVHFWTFG
jgi:cytochrome oxidase Cu insertion factor (SCO1/SenC/PrrC family)